MINAHHAVPITTLPKQEWARLNGGLLVNLRQRLIHC